MKLPDIIGADLSKGTIDFATPQRQHLKVTNNLKGFEQLLTWMGQLQLAAAEVLIVMEHTGVYSFKLEAFLWKRNIAFAKVSGLAIKRSLGLVRGKNDHIDAVRIARYGLEKRDQLQAFTPATATLNRLKVLYQARNRLVKQQAALLTAMRSYTDGGVVSKGDVVAGIHRQVLKTLARSVEKLEKQMAQVINADPSVKVNYELLQSEKGVGPVVALAAVVKTGNFTRFKTARQFCCYSGTAPFEHCSGSSIRGKTRVSHLADKDMKRLLFMAAESAIQHDPELKAYYQKRTLKGKPKMNSLNIISNKIIFRMFAIIKRQTPFIENYKRAI